MKHRNLLPTLLALASLGALVALFPPGTFSWRAFFTDQSTTIEKLLFLAKVYGTPAALSFVSVVLFQMQMRMALLGLAGKTIFPLSLFASAAMMASFRTMAAGVGGVPGYALGVAAAYTIMSRIYAIRPSERTILGKPFLRIVWRGDREAVHEVTARRQMAGAGR